MKQSTLHLPRNIPHQFPLCNIYKARYYAGYETGRRAKDVIRWPRDDNLKSFPTEGPHLVFDTDRPESAGGDVLESFRSSMTLDFLRQRFALTRIQPSFPHQFLLFHPRVFVSAPFAAWTRVRGRDRRGGRVRGSRGGVGKRLAKLYRKYLLTGEEQGGDGIFDITLERR